MNQHREHSRGFVLAVVLVMLTLVSIAVAYLSRQGVLDELLARNDRQSAQLDAAAQYTLRYCERWLRCAPPGLPVGAGCSVRPAIAPGVAGSLQASVAAYANTIDPGDLVNMLGAGAIAQCVFEDASSQLAQQRTLDNGNLAGDAQWGKFILTAIVTRPSPFILGNDEVTRVQSEVRLLLSGI